MHYELTELQPGLLYNLTVKEVDDAVGVGSVVLGVRHHHDGGAIAVELCEKFHHLFPVYRVKITGRLICDDEVRS